MALKLYKGREVEPSGPATNLSEPVHSFVGRARELTALREAFAPGEARLVTLIGAPGVGKTRLAREFGRLALAEGLFHEVWFCDLMDARTPTHFLTALGTVLRANRFDDDPEEMLTGLALLLQGRGEVLLILDNVEQLAAEAGAIVSESLRLLPGARFLVTSREPLRLPRETRFTVSPLSLDEAVTLFEERATAVRTDLELLDSDRDDVRDLVERLDRFPLAIELAAARSTVLTPAQIRTRLDERFKLLRDTHGSLSRRQLTLRGALDWSWEMLSPWERAALRQCSVFRGGFTFEAAEAVIDLSDDPDAPWTVDILAALFDRSLLHTYRADGLPQAVRYALYTSIREYAAEKLEPGEREAVERRHAEYYSQAAAGWNDALDGPDEVATLARFDADRANVTAALDRFEARDPLLVVRTVLSLERLYSIRETFEAQNELFRRGLRVLDGQEQLELRALIIARRAFHLANRGRTEEARPDIELAEESLAGAPPSEATYVMAKARGAYHLGRAELDQAEAAFERSAAIARALENLPYEGGALLFLGMVWSARADSDAADRPAHLERARDEYEKALRIFEALGAARYQSALLLNIGNIHARGHRRAEQRHYYELALARAQAVQHRLLEGAISQALGRLAADEMRYDDAEPLLLEGIRIQREVGRHDALAIALRYAGIMHADRGQYSEAISWFLEAADTAKTIRSALIGSEVHFWLGLTQLAAGQLADARKRFQACQQDGERLGDASRVGVGLAAEAAALALMGETSRAAEMWARAEAYELPTFLPTPREAVAFLAAIVKNAGRDDAEERKAARRMVRQVTADPAASMPALRILAGILDRLLTDSAAVQSVEGGALHEAAGGERLVVGAGLSFIQPPGGERIDLRRRRVLRRLVQRLVDERAASPGSTLTVDQLIEAGWPGQTFVGDSANSRVYVAVATLRELGLADVLLTRAGGYLFDPHVELVLLDA